MFSKSSLFSGLLVAGLVVGAHGLFRTPFNRVPRPDAWAGITYTPIALPDTIQGTERFAGAWELTSSDPRLGGLSALAIDRGALIALTDSGVVIRLPRPGRAARQALFRDLPDGPGDPRRKSRRDSEALSRLADGDWLVAFENRNQLWRYDAAFRTGRRVVRFTNQGWLQNRGIEAMALGRNGGLVVIPEGRGAFFAVSETVETRPLSSEGWTVSDAARMSDGRTMLLLRRITIAGFRNAIGELVLTKAGWRVAVRTQLPLDALDNAEGLAAEQLPGGGTRLWIVTDNDFAGYRRTLLLAVDLSVHRAG